MITTVVCDAEVSELADEQDSGSCERYAREGSSPFFRMELYAPNPVPKGGRFGFTVQSSYKEREKSAVSFMIPLLLLYIIPQKQKKSKTGIVLSFRSLIRRIPNPVDCRYTIFKK